MLDDHSRFNAILEALPGAEGRLLQGALQRAFERYGRPIASTQRPAMGQRRTRAHPFATTRVRYGHRRLHVLLKREGWTLGRNQCYRIYSEESLQLRSKPPKRRKMVIQRRERAQAKRPGDTWSMDFVANVFSNGGKFRILTVVDVFARRALAIDAGHRLKGGTS